MRIDRDDGPVVRCIACDEQLRRSNAREYDRFGDRWDRDGKAFEYLCKPCHATECHFPRDGLEETLIAVGCHHDSTRSFVRRYYRHVQNRVGSGDG